MQTRSLRVGHPESQFLSVNKESKSALSCRLFDQDHKVTSQQFCVGHRKETTPSQQPTLGGRITAHDDDRQRSAQLTDGRGEEFVCLHLFFVIVHKLSLSHIVSNMNVAGNTRL